MTKTLSIVWISCSAGNSAAELLQECQRACVVSTCLPSRALATIAAGATTVVIFDYGDPLAADLHLLQSVKRQHPSLPILMLTDTHSADLAVWAMRARVWNYLVKPVPLRELKTNLEQLAKLPSRRDTGTREVLRPATMLQSHIEKQTVMATRQCCSGLWRTSVAIVRPGVA